MSDSGSSGSTGSDDPYDPNRPSQPDQPRWGANPPASDPPTAPQFEPPSSPPGAPGWGGGQLSSGSGQPAYGAGQFGQPYGQPYGQPTGSPPPNYLVPAILSTVFCCLPLGIASIVFAAQVNGKYASGDLAGAQEASRKAKQFAIWSAAVSLVILVIYVLFFVAVIANGN